MPPSMSMKSVCQAGAGFTAMRGRRIETAAGIQAASASMELSLAQPRRDMILTHVYNFKTTSPFKR